MADPVVPPAQAAIADPGTANIDPAEPKTFTMTEQHWDEIQGLKKTVNSLAAMLRKQTQAVPPVVPAVVVEEPEPTTQKAKIEKLILDAQKALEETKQKDIAYNARVRRTGIREAMTTLGVVDPNIRELLEDHLEQKHGPNIKIGSNEQVLIVDELEQEKDIGDFISELLKTPKGKIFVPVRTPGPNVRAGRGGSAAIPGQKNALEMSPIELAQLPAEQRLAAFRQAK